MAQTIIVDISTRGANPVAYTHQGDTGRTFFAEIYENGEAFAVAGYTIKVGAILPADRGYYVIAGNDMVTATKTNDDTTNKIYFTLSNKYSLKAGNGILTLIFTSNTGTPSTIRPINIDLRIQKSADADDTIAGASDFPEGLEAIAEEVFQEYLSTYLPPVAPSSSAAANKAADAKLTGEALDDLKSDLYEQVEKDFAMSDFTWESGYIDTNGSVVSHQHYKCTNKVKTVSGTTITFTNLRAPANYYPAIACYSNGVYNNSASAKGDEYTSYKSGTFTIPDGIDEVAFVTYYSASYPVNVSMTVVESVVARLSSQMEMTNDEIDALEDKTQITLATVRNHSDVTSYDTAYLNTSGNTVSYANAYVSDYISVIPEDSIECKIAHIYGASLAVAFYKSNKTFISGIIADSGTSGNWSVANGTYLIPSNAVYMRFSMSKSSVGGIYAREQFIKWNSNMTLKDYVLNDILPNVGSQWMGKKWCAFGTSITDTSYMNQETGEVTGKYVPFLADLSGMSVTNRGIAGGTIGSGGIHGGSSSILNAILNSDDLDEYDLITIEGFVNDFAAAVSIGEIGDTANTSMYGALYQAISYCLSNSHAEIVLITETTGREYQMSGGTTANYTILRKNSLNLYQQDYNDVITRIGQFYGVHVIDAGGKSQINQYHPEYIIDQIHHTNLGGEQYAKTIWEELKTINPAKVSNS